MLLACVLTAHVLSASPPPTPQPTPTASRTTIVSPLVPEPEDSVGALYASTDGGGKKMICTVTAIDYDGTVTTFLTAAHCLERPDTLSRKGLSIGMEDGEIKTYEPATVSQVGRSATGYDFARLTIPKKIPTLPLGDELSEARFLRITVVEEPGGLGKARVHGVVVLKQIIRAFSFESGPEAATDWTGMMLLDLRGAGGASGAAVISDDTCRIIAILTGFAGDGQFTVAMPISRAINPPRDMVSFQRK